MWPRDAKETRMRDSFPELDAAGIVKVQSELERPDGFSDWLKRITSNV